jgi:hypothetical protein
VYHWERQKEPPGETEGVTKKRQKESLRERQKESLGETEGVIKKR